LEKKQGGIVEYATDRPEDYTGEIKMQDGTLTHPPQRKGKYPITRSPCQQDATTIVLPHIPEGVRVTDNMLGCVEKIGYSNHDVTDMEKFLEFEKRFYLDTVGIGPVSSRIHPQTTNEVSLETFEYGCVIFFLCRWINQSNNREEGNKLYTI